MHRHMQHMQQVHQQQLLMYVAKRREAAQLVSVGRYREAVQILAVLVAANPGDEQARDLLQAARRQAGLPAEEPGGTAGTGAGCAVLLAVLFLIGVLVIGVGYLWVNRTVPDTGVSGTVRQGTQWNLRAGPGSRWPVVGRLKSGDRVVVACATGRWARLTEPHAGRYVYAAGLNLRREPPPCQVD